MSGVTYTLPQLPLSWFFKTSHKYKTIRKFLLTLKVNLLLMCSFVANFLDRVSSVF